MGIKVDVHQHDKGKKTYSAFVDFTKTCGILRSTNELSLNYELDDQGNVKIQSGWEFNCGGDWTWEPGEEEYLEQHHPGILKELASAAKTA